MHIFVYFRADHDDDEPIWLFSSIQYSRMVPTIILVFFHIFPAIYSTSIAFLPRCMPETKCPCGCIVGCLILGIGVMWYHVQSRDRITIMGVCNDSEVLHYLLLVGRYCNTLLCYPQWKGIFTCEQEYITDHWRFTAYGTYGRLRVSIHRITSPSIVIQSNDFYSSNLPLYHSIHRPFEPPSSPIIWRCVIQELTRLGWTKALKHQCIVIWPARAWPTINQRKHVHFSGYRFNSMYFIIFRILFPKPLV